MIPIKFDIVEKAIADFSTDIEKQRSDASDKLNILKYKLTVPSEIDYLGKIMPLFDKNKDAIICAKPDVLKDLSKKNGTNEIKLPVFDKNKDAIICAKPDVLKDLSKKNGTNEIKLPVDCSKDFSEKILECLDYDSLRQSFYPKFFSKIGIKACVYCNSQLTVVTEGEKGNFSARFDLDHYINKSDYPFLSISLYNLYPVCASCNRKKLKSNIPFELYQEDIKPSDYHFELNAGSVAKYLVSQNANDISISFEPKDSELNKKLGIKEIYDTQKDLVEEMIVKNQIYNDAYIATLKTSFQSLFQNPDLFDRVIYGNYMKEEDIHKRPMSKFTQDMTEELKKIARK